MVDKFPEYLISMVKVDVPSYILPSRFVRSALKKSARTLHAPLLRQYCQAQPMLEHGTKTQAETEENGRAKRANTQDIPVKKSSRIWAVWADGLNSSPNKIGPQRS